MSLVLSAAAACPIFGRCPVRRRSACCSNWSRCSCSAAAANVCSSCAADALCPPLLSVWRVRVTATASVYSARLLPSSCGAASLVSHGDIGNTKCGIEHHDEASEQAVAAAASSHTTAASAACSLLAPVAPDAPPQTHPLAVLSALEVSSGSDFKGRRL
jgi:hypothetical protein